VQFTSIIAEHIPVNRELHSIAYTGIQTSISQQANQLGQSGFC